MRKTLVTALAALPLSITPSVRTRPPPASLVIEAPRVPLFSHSRAPLRISGSDGSPQLTLLGRGRLEGMTYVAPDIVERPARATIVAGARDAAGSIEITLAPWPKGERVFAVACYDDGVALHRARDGALLGVLALDGGVADVAQLDGALVAPSTTADVLWSIDIATGSVRKIDGVPTGNEVVAFRHDAYVTNRDVAGDGALTRVRDGTSMRIVTGVTAEGLAIDPTRAVAYVGNVNDRSVAAVDLARMRVVRRIPAPERTFGLTFDPSSQRLDVVSNVPRTPARTSGHVESIDVATGRVRARSAPMTFPLGIALDRASRRAFVTDEADGTVAVLDARTLRPVHKPLQACDVAWRPTLDRRTRRLYIPCARANAVAAFDLRTLRALPGSPYATGGYPLGVAPVLTSGEEPLRDEEKPENQAYQAHRCQVSAREPLLAFSRLSAKRSDHCLKPLLHRRRFRLAPFIRDTERPQTPDHLLRSRKTLPLLTMIYRFDYGSAERANRR